ncbi:MAG: hypothetical protein AB7O70_02585, partial [Hyphomicrobiales bacterium]
INQLDGTSSAGSIWALPGAKRRQLPYPGANRRDLSIFSRTVFSDVESSLTAPCGKRIPLNSPDFSGHASAVRPSPGTPAALDKTAPHAQKAGCSRGSKQNSQFPRKTANPEARRPGRRTGSMATGNCG